MKIELRRKLELMVCVFENRIVNANWNFCDRACKC